MLSLSHPVTFADPGVVPADINLSDTNSDLDTDSDLAAGGADEEEAEDA